MKRLVLATFALVGAVAALPAAAGPGDVYVPAHRTANGLWVPANVPPSSGGTRMARKLPAHAAKPAAAASSGTPSGASTAAMPPLFVAAEPIRR